MEEGIISLVTQQWDPLLFPPHTLHQKGVIVLSPHSREEGLDSAFGRRKPQRICKHFKTTTSHSYNI